VVVFCALSSCWLRAEDKVEPPRGPAPYFSMIRLSIDESDGKGTYVCIYDARRDTLTNLDVYILMIGAPLKRIPIYDNNGTQLTQAEAKKRLTDGVLALRSADGKPIDPKYLKLLSKDTLVVLAQQDVNLPSH